MSDFRTPLGKVRGLGAAREGTGAFWTLRLTALFNIPLVLFAIGLVVSLAGADHARFTAAVAHPLVAVLLVALIVSACVHMRLGMKEVIEDYVHGALARVTLLLASTAFVAVVGGVAVFSILKIAFGG